MKIYKNKINIWFEIKTCLFSKYLDILQLYYKGSKSLFTVNIFINVVTSIVTIKWITTILNCIFSIGSIFFVLNLYWNFPWFFNCLKLTLTLLLTSTVTEDYKRLHFVKHYHGKQLVLKNDPKVPNLMNYPHYYDSMLNKKQGQKVVHKNVS